MKAESSTKLTSAPQADLDHLAELSDSDIDLEEMPEVRDWSAAHRGLFYRPIKKQLTLRLDADIIAWFKTRASANEKYQTNINRVLREYVEKHGRSV